jgi:hypothetical protein
MAYLFRNFWIPDVCLDVGRGPHIQVPCSSHARIEAIQRHRFWKFIVSKKKIMKRLVAVFVRRREQRRMRRKPASAPDQLKVIWIHKRHLFSREDGEIKPEAPAVPVH